MTQTELETGVEQEIHTETTMMEKLEARFCQDSGNGPAAALMPQVRDGAGFNSKRTLDAVVLGMWPSRGLLLQGFEIKVSRKDWRKELRDPSKAEAFLPMLDMFWIAAAPGVVKLEEMPENWGLLVATKRGLTEKKPALLLHGDKPSDLPPGFTRRFLVPLIRQAGAITPRQRQQIAEREVSHMAHRMNRAEQQLKELKAAVAEFQRASGVTIADSGYAFPGHSPAERGEAFRLLLSGDATAKRHRRSLERLAEAADLTADQIRKELTRADEEM